MNIKTKILIVDDEINSRYLIQQILDFDGNYTYKSVETGEEALEIIPLFRPDIILLDIVLPGINGYKVCQQIRNKQNYKFTKIIMISGGVEVKKRLDGYKAGANDYITKPFDPEELLAKISIFEKLKHSEEVDKIKSDLFTIFSHEARTPLNGVFGGIQILKDYKLAPKQAKVINEAFDSANKLRSLVDSVISLCQLKSDKNLSLSENFISHQLRYDISYYDSNISAKNLIFSVNTDKQDIKINTDWNLLSRAFRLILGISIDLSESSAEVKIDHKVDHNSQYVKISIFSQKVNIDNIKSFTGEEKELFQIMRQKNNRGLYLLIAKTIMENINGKLEINYSKGLYHFEFLIPNSIND